MDKDLQHLAAIVRDSDDAIIGKTLEGIITSWNGGAERIYGYSAEEAIGRTVAMLMPPDREDELPGILQKLIQGQRINNYDTLRVTKDGSLVNISLTVSPIRDASGAIIGASSIGRDVTNEKKAEAALQESARAYKLLMEQASDAIIISYPDQPLIEVNQRASDMLGYTREDLLQLRGAGNSNPLPEGLSAAPFPLDEILAGAIVIIERPVRRKDGTEIITELSTRRLDDGRIVTIARDITARKQAEAELQKREAQLSEAQEIAHIGSWQADLMTREAVWSEELYRIFGVEPQSNQANFEQFSEYVHPDDKGMVSKEMERAQREGGIFEYEYRVQCPDGAVKTLCTRGRLVLDEDGLPTGIVGTTQDITDRKLADQQIQFQAQVLDQVQAAVIATDMQGIITHWNGYAEKLYGWQREEALGQPIRLLTVGPQDIDLAEEIMTQVMAEGSWEGEFTVRRKDGSTFPAYVVDTIIRDQAGRAIGIAGISVDIIERKQAEEALRSSGEKFRAIFENTLDSMFISDDMGRYVDVNPAACKLIGLPAEKLLGHSYTEFQSWKPTVNLEYLQERVTEQGSISGGNHFISADGQSRDVEFFAIANFIPGFHLSVAHDLTERKQAEQEHLAKEAAEQANRAKSAFLSRMSHELRTPLNAILGFGQLLQLDGTSPEQQESIEYILKAGKHLLNLVNEVLEISRIEEDNFELLMEPVFICDVLHESIELVQTLAARQEIKINADMALMDKFYAMADRQRLQQVLLNLIANAIKYNHEGGTVTVSCTSSGVEEGDAALTQIATDSPQSPTRVRIAVSDTGPGLSPEKVALLFTPFERAGAEQGDVEGTGLGLAISKHLVEAMGGAIGVDAVPGGGCTFWVDLWRADEPKPKAESLVTGPVYNLQLGAQVHTMLYIEDNLSNLKLIEHILKRWPGLNLITALQGQMGLDMAFEHRPDMILLDLHLPDIQGNEVLRRLQEDPRTAHIPVVILSADANPRQAEKLLQAGAQAYLTKPFDVKQLLAVLGKTVAQRVS